MKTSLYWVYWVIDLTRAYTGSLYFLPFMDKIYLKLWRRDGICHECLGLQHPRWLRREKLLHNSLFWSQVSNWPRMARIWAFFYLFWWEYYFVLYLTHISLVWCPTNFSSNETVCIKPCRVRSEHISLRSLRNSHGSRSTTNGVWSMAGVAFLKFSNNSLFMRWKIIVEKFPIGKFPPLNLVECCSHFWITSVFFGWCLVEDLSTR